MKKSALLIALTVLLAAVAIAQGASPDKDKLAVLKPPPGSKVAIVVFQDLQCPDCARAHPLLEDAKSTYKIPLVQHDFPLPMHNWSFEAAVIARFFDTKSQAIGDEWRTYCYSNQQSITPDNLNSRAEDFADQHKIAFPFAVDPTGALGKKVRADFALGQRIGIQHTPTIFVVGANQTAQPFVEVVDRSQLFSIIDGMKASVGPEKSAAVETKGHHASVHPKRAKKN